MKSGMWKSIQYWLIFQILVEMPLIKVDSYVRSVATDRGGARGEISEPNKVHQLQTSRILVFMDDQKLHGQEITIFTVYATIFEQFTVAFHFFYLHERNRPLHFTLDLLKSFSLYTIWNVIVASKRNGWKLDLLKKQKLDLLRKQKLDLLKKQKLDLLKSFSKIREAPPSRISGSQLSNYGIQKSNYGILLDLGKDPLKLDKVLWAIHN